MNDMNVSGDLEIAESRELLALSSAQQGIWLDQVAHPDSTHYIIGAAIVVDGALDVAAFETAVRHAANLYDALRIVLHERSGVAHLSVLPRVDITVELLDYSGADDAEARARDYLYRAYNKPFELYGSLLWETQLIQVSPTRHYWLQRYHHLVSDGVGAVAYANAVIDCYNKLLRGEPLPTEQGPSYLEFLAEDRAYLASRRYVRDLDFWCNRFAEIPPPLLPHTDHQPAPGGVHCDQVVWMVGRPLFQQITAFASDRDLSVTHFFLALICAYLARTLAARQIVVGLSVHNRFTARHRRTVGTFASVIPVVIEVDQWRSFVDLMGGIATELRRCFRYQKAPLAEVNRRLKLAQHGRRQLFDVTFSFENFFDEHVFDGGIEAEFIPVRRDSPQGPLGIVIHDWQQAYDVPFEFNFELSALARERVERARDSMALIVDAVLTGTDRSIDDLPLMSRDETDRLTEFFEGPRLANAEELIHRLFEEQVERAGQAIAVTDGCEQLTYAQLNERANQLAHYLMKQGVGADELVALYMERSIELVVSVLGVLKAGGAYVPIDPAHPRTRVEQVLKDAKPRALITQERLAGQLPQTSAAILVIETSESVLRQEPATNLDARRVQLRPQHLAYVLYTSGSTGTPKGVMVEHRNLVNYALYAAERFDVAHGSGSLICTSLSFDLTLTSFYPPLISGRPLRLCGEGQDLPELCRALLESENLAPLKLTPSHLKALQQVLPAKHLSGRVRTLVLGGEPLANEAVQYWMKHAPETRVFNHYGPTEATVGCVVYEIEEAPVGPVPIGRPIANTKIYILDERQRAVGIGVVGEIYIGGAGVARGYLNQAELTAQRFMRDPFSAEPAARMYRTGDMGRWRADGNIEFLGRNDSQVKIRGFRIELGEIEARLAAYPGIGEVAVIAREEVAGEKRLVAYYTCTAEAPGIEELRTYLKLSLPEYMVPVAYVRLERLPLTGNGKLDRRALPAPDCAAVHRQQYEAPEGELEIALASLWQELLQVERVGRRDNFFELGGHSLLAVQLLTRVRSVLQRELALRDLFEEPTLHAVAKRLSGSALSALPAIARADRAKPLSLSYAQQRLWFVDQLEGAGPAYHIAGALKLQGELDRPALQGALDTILQRHEVLRTVFTQQEGHPIQVIAPAARFALREVDLRHEPAVTREAVFRIHIAAEAGERFDLRVGPLIRARLIRLGEQEHVLAIVMHHIVSDGWSIGVLIRELGALYGAHREGHAGSLAALPIQYADYAQWQRQWLQGEVLQAQLAYWKAQLAGAPALLELPTDRPRPAEQSYRGESIDVVLDKKLTVGLRDLVRRHEATLYMALLAGWSLMLSRLSGQPEVVIGTPIANRQRTEVEGLIGFFVNTLALRVRMPPEQSVSELLRQVKELTLNAYTHQDVPFEQVVEELQPVRSLSHSPVFQVMLTLQNQPRSELQLPGVRWVREEVPGTKSQFDLMLSLHESAEQIVGRLAYASDLFERSTVERWVGYLQAALSAMVADTQQLAGAITLLSAGERDQILYRFNATGAVYAKDKLIHELFESQVEQTPRAVAVVHDEQQLTYEELNRRSNQLAHYLRKRGVGPDELVAVCVERGVEMIVALLGVLKAGGAYMPLDPAYPRERLEYMLNDAAPRLLLTQDHLKEQLPGASAARIPIDRDWNEIEQEDGSNLDPAHLALTPRHLSYVIYTSGSTGQPKGVAIEHGNAVNLICWARHALSPEIFKSTLFSTSLNFDLAVYECFVPLATGGCVWVVRNVMELASKPADVFLINTVPSGIRALLDAGAIPRTARVINLAGEPLKQELVERIFASSTVESVCNLYGPSETTTYSTWVEMPRAGGFLSSIGSPIANTQIYIIDERLAPVPIGVVGSIYIGGAGVARGYLNQPELTAARFLKDPFNVDAQARMYKTGDVGRWRADGTIEYLGRNDHQVKIRGYRIELGEIEAQLMRHTQIHEAVVLAREDVPGDKRLVAYVTCTNEEAVGSEELRAHLTLTLPEYMIPSAFVKLAALPLTPNGKVDRKALPAANAAAGAGREYEAPAGELEETLAGIWQQLLSVERVGRQDNFFELGGHSLLTMQLLDRLRRVGLSTTVRTVFEHPTLSDLCATLRGGVAQKVEAPAYRIPAGCEAITPEMLTLIDLTAKQIEQIVSRVPGGAGNVQDIYPLAPLQEGILFHHLLGQQRDAYVLSTLLTVQSRSQLEGLLSALQGVIDRHDILRSAVLWEGLPRPVQVVYRQAQLRMEEIELAAGEDAQEHLKSRLASQQEWLDIRSAPLMRVKVAHDARSSQWYVLLCQHHLIGDHIGREIFLKEFIAHLRGQIAELSVPVAYREFVWAALQQVHSSEAEEFFRGKLGDVEEPTAPFGLMNVHGDGSQIEQVDRSVEEELSLRIRSTARRLGVSAATLFHAAWALVVARTSGRDDVVFGSVLSGRMQDQADIGRVMGMFINTLPLRIRLEDVSAEQLVRQVQREIVELLQYEQASLAVAQRCSAVDRSAPLFSAVLNYRHRVSVEAPELELANAAKSFGIQVLALQERTNYPLMMSVTDLGEGFALNAQTDRRIDPLRVVSYLSTALGSLLEALEGAPQSAALSLSILPQSERHQVVELFNATGAVYPRERLIHELFEEQVQKTPRAVAVVHDDQQLTYEELNRKSNQLAHYLRERGVGPDQRVAICVERGFEMVMGLLGILKAGGAYVPLDTAHPSARLASIIEDAAPQVMLTQAHLEEQFSQNGVTTIALDAHWSEIAQCAQSNLDAGSIGLRSHHLAYVIYTSGSTGRPKGVMVEHTGVVNFLLAMQEQPGLCAQDCLLALTTVSFDIAALELYVPLISGARVVVASRELASNTELLSGALERFGVTVLQATPTTWRMLLDVGWPGRSTLKGLCGGEALSVELAQRLRGRIKEVWNLYGPTETTIWSSGRRVTHVGKGSHPVESIGTPITNTRIYILDQRLQPVPMGVTGEICIAGAGVARGYLNRPELTAERFVRDPFGSDGQGHLYRTGDLGRWRADGQIEYLGRNDQQMKIRGYRIELEEIEAHLRAHAQLREAVVIARVDVRGEKQLVAYFTQTAEERVSIESLRGALQGVLPEYMIPSAFVRLETLPLTPNGKVDRKALPAPDSHSLVRREYEAPQGPIEEALANIWRELLPVEQVGREDSFFDLGGQSLLAVQLLIRIRNRYPIAVPLAWIFTFPTLKALSQCVADALTELKHYQAIEIGQSKVAYDQNLHEEILL